MDKKSVWFLYVGGYAKLQVVENFDIGIEHEIWGSKNSDTFSYNGSSLKKGDFIVLVCGYQIVKDGINQNRFGSISEMKKRFVLFRQLIVGKATSDVFVDNTPIWPNDTYPIRFTFEKLNYFSGFSLDQTIKIFKEQNLDTIRLAMIPRLRIRPLVADIIDFYSLIGDFLIDQFEYPEEIANNDVLLEGAKTQILVNAYERNPIARKRCIEFHGTRCHVCGFDFNEIYGDIGKGYIHVHHIKSLAEIDQEYVVNPISDLGPVCPNCHAMLHMKSPPYTIQEMKDIISSVQ